MLNDVYTTARHKMDTSLDALRKELASVRTGRASITLLDDVKVDAYGQEIPLNQVANLTVPEASLIVVRPFDPSQIPAIEKAIYKANLGVTPSSDGKMVRVPIPPLTEERRRELAKKVKESGEDIKTAIRNVRREANEEIKKLEKDKAVSQDEEKVGLKKIQEMTDEVIMGVDETVRAKEKELLEL